MEQEVYYIATRKDSGAHHLFIGPDYLERYEREFERIREFESLEDAKSALASRETTDRKAANELKRPKSKNIRAGKLRGDIRKGSLDEEDVRAKLRAEIEAELRAELEAKEVAGNSGKMGPKTSQRTANAKKEE